MTPDERNSSRSPLPAEFRTTTGKTWSQNPCLPRDDGVASTGSMPRCAHPCDNSQWLRDGLAGPPQYVKSQPAAAPAGHLPPYDGLLREIEDTLNATASRYPPLPSYIADIAAQQRQTMNQTSRVYAPNCCKSWRANRSLPTPLVAPRRIPLMSASPSRRSPSPNSRRTICAGTNPCLPRRRRPRWDC